MNTDQRAVRRVLADPMVTAGVEIRVENKLRGHQEPDGSYACDPHVMVTYVLNALLDELGG